MEMPPFETLPIVAEQQWQPQSDARQAERLQDEFAQSQEFVQLANHNQATVGGNSGTLEIDSQRGVERALKKLVLYLPPRFVLDGARGNAMTSISKTSGRWTYKGLK
jgi:hypothetical protein